MSKVWLFGLAVITLLTLARVAPKAASTVLPALMAAQPHATADPQQYPILDKIADKIIQKYQTSTCQQLYQEKAEQQGKPKPEEVQRAIGILRNDPEMRQVFINKIAAPIANKMFECGMIP
jgi:hypothetical protein